MTATPSGAGLEGTRLVLMPGMEGTGALFAPFVAALPPTPAPVVVRYPVDEPLEPPALIERVKALLPVGERFALVAESYSGPLALRLAAQLPPGLAAVVLVATYAKSPLGPWLSRVHPIGSLAFSLPPSTSFIRGFLTGDDAPEELVQASRAAIRSVRATVMGARLRHALTDDVSAEASRCPVPLLYLRGTRDRLIPPRSQAELQALVPAMRSVDLDSAHFVLQRAPELSARAIDAFLRELC